VVANRRPIVNSEIARFFKLVLYVCAYMCGFVHVIHLHRRMHVRASGDLTAA
jgi:hypothetical protein